VVNAIFAVITMVRGKVAAR